MDDHGSRRTASTTDRTARQNPAGKRKWRVCTDTVCTDTVCTDTVRRNALTRHWLVCPGGLEEHVTRSAKPEPRAPWRRIICRTLREARIRP
ncbi:hypothetical protein PAMC26510_18675 [Caballeronia sordidicola]|uniref:Uncharacterized protein n=1 Tax=Caballeronia sordidicola TaxID=196367 RepID=A0A242MPP3_CABSO|nr:hypothetical protein PAMC26510_18675 [Caballeronia sordidicola]